MDEMLFRVLAEAVRGYLDGVERSPTPAETRRLVGAWRALLTAHAAGGRRCGGCRRRGTATAMCGVWRVAVNYFVHRTRSHDITD